MAEKPNVSVRKPPAEDNTADIEEFINSGDAQTSKHSDGQTSERSNDNNERRRTTIYFNADTAKKLRIYCAAEDREMSEVTNQAVAEFLSNKDFP